MPTGANTLVTPGDARDVFDDFRLSPPRRLLRAATSHARQFHCRLCALIYRRRRDIAGDARRQLSSLEARYQAFRAR